MAKKPRTEKQLANDERLRNRSKIKAEESNVAAELKEDVTDHVAEDQNIDDLKRQVAETQALLKAFMAGASSIQANNQAVGVGRDNKLVGEVEKYLVDPANYPDPTPRLAKEKRLHAVNFLYNYELEYELKVSSYETKTGVNMREPKFHITLNRIVLDDQGAQTSKRYIARRLIFHEDPQAAIVIARENNLPVDETNEKQFLDEMRYLRVRDWLFDIFWPKPVNPASQIREEVIGGTLVQVFTKSSEDSSSIDFDKLDTKIQV